MAKRKTKRIKTAPNHTLWTITVLVLILLACILISDRSAMRLPTPSAMPPMQQTQSFDFANQSIMLNDQSLTFTNGTYKSADQQENAMIIYRSVNAVGNRAAAIVVDNPGGSGTFFYVIGAMRKNGKTVYSTPVQLGDRVKIESVAVDDPQAEDNGIITVQYLDHPSDQPMSDDPTMQVTAKFAFQDDGNLIAVLH